MIVLIDNYDSFSYNLYQLIGELEPDIRVIRNDGYTVEEIQAMEPTHIILSPGPGRPDQAGVCEQVVKELQGKVPILGVCLGHQAICEAYGAVISYARELMHGKMSVVQLDQDCPLFRGIPQKAQAARYHSLIAKRDTIPDVLKVTGVTEDGEVMAVEHRKYLVYGLQFHPESIMTPEGKNILKNFLNQK